MAKEHVIDYYLQMEYQYIEMLDDLKELKALLAEGKIDEETYASVETDVEKLRDNYERLSYIMWLLNKPKRKDRRVSKDTLNWYNSLQSASKEALLDENKDVLATFKQLLAKGELNHEE